MPPLLPDINGRTQKLYRLKDSFKCDGAHSAGQAWLKILREEHRFEQLLRHRSGASGSLDVCVTTTNEKADGVGMCDGQLLCPAQRPLAHLPVNFHSGILAGYPAGRQSVNSNTITKPIRSYQSNDLQSHSLQHSQCCISTPVGCHLAMIQKRRSWVLLYMEVLMTRASVETLDETPSAVIETEITKSEAGCGASDPAFFRSASVESWRYWFIKRFLDLLGSVSLIVLLAIPAAMIAVVIRCTSKGPVIYRERRIGRYGRGFRILKFRSMYSNAAQRARIEGAHSGVLEWRMRKHAGDPRITPIGRLLRRWSLDELPQLMNVFRGEMSLIGPRPIVEAETAFYGDLFSYYLAVTPGLSGLWQVSGRSEIGYAKRAKLDAMYVGAWSLRSDFTILLRTIPAVLGHRGAR